MAAQTYESPPRDDVCALLCTDLLCGCNSQGTKLMTRLDLQRLYLQNLHQQIFHRQICTIPKLKQSSSCNDAVLMKLHHWQFLLT